MSSGALRVRVVLNPTAAAGGAARRIERIREALRRHDLGDDIVVTRGPGHATRLAEQARDEGVELLVVAGGDGTLGEVAQAYVDEAGRAKPGPELAVLPLGTGGDFRKTLGVGKDLDAAIERLRGGRSRPVDVGYLQLDGMGAGLWSRVFINVASFGMGGLVDDLVNRGPKWMGGRASFFLASLRALPAWTPATVRVRLDGEPFFEGPIMNVCIANGRYFGGGMFIAPEARVDDGLFDVVVLGAQSIPRSLLMAVPLYRGTHVRAAHVRTGRGRVVEAEVVSSAGPVRFDIDGEGIGTLPARARVVPGALTMRA